MRIFLVRHGQSIANADKRVHVTMADHAIPLSNLGREQAMGTAKFLKEMFSCQPWARGNVRLWKSPYRRARETALPIVSALGDTLNGNRENILLCEQQFGLFDGISHEGTKNEIKEKYPNEHEHYRKCEEFEGAFWARMPLGESKFDLCQRVHQFFGTIQRDYERHRIDNVIIVAHGSTNRAYAMMWLHHSFEWFEKEPNPKNGSVRLIDNNKDEGYIYEG